MKNLPLIFFILFAGNSMASSLPNCPSDASARHHNCFGTYTSDAGKYVGEFKDNKYYGQGTYTFANGDKYVGEFKDDRKHGQGTTTYHNGDKYLGEWKDGKKHGQGTYTFANGDKYVGKFKDGENHGQGTATFASGAILRGYYMNGEFVPDICKDMGLTKGSESFGQCVLKLIDKIDEDD